MRYDEKTDLILNELLNRKSLVKKDELDKIFKDKIDPLELERLLKSLDKNGCIETVEFMGYRIIGTGLSLLEDGGYTKKTKREKQLRCFAKWSLVFIIIDILVTIILNLI